jgi:hypothetical protein
MKGHAFQTHTSKRFALHWTNVRIDKADLLDLADLSYGPEEVTIKWLATDRNAAD